MNVHYIILELLVQNMNTGKRFFFVKFGGVWIEKILARYLIIHLILQRVPNLFEFLASSQKGSIFAEILVL